MKLLPETPGTVILVGFSPTAQDCDFNSLQVLTRIHFVISGRLYCTCSLNQARVSSPGFLEQKTPEELTNWLIPVTRSTLRVPCPQP